MRGAQLVHEVDVELVAVEAAALKERENLGVLLAHDNLETRAIKCRAHDLHRLAAIAAEKFNHLALRGVAKVFNADNAALHVGGALAAGANGALLRALRKARVRHGGIAVHAVRAAAMFIWTGKN